MEFILRFSEPESSTGPDTVARHQAVLRISSGGVWWGWWRKRVDNRRWGEDFQSRTWDELERRIKNNPAVEVFLVNNQGPYFYIAKCVEVRRSDGRAIKAPNPDLVPEYYREGRFPAWLRFIDIKKTSGKRYRERCGESLPHRHATLFTAKQEGREIRIEPMPHWERHALPAAGNGILQISDLHIVPGQPIPPGSDRPGSSELLDRIRQVVDIVELDIGLVVVSGDIVNGVRVEGLSDVEAKYQEPFDAAEVFLGSMCEALGLDRRAILLVPGNHDLPILEGEELRNAKKQYVHYSAFNKFVAQFYRLKGDVKAVQYCERPVVVKFPSASVAFALFDSCRLRDRQREHLGYVANHQAVPILRWLSEWQADANPDAAVRGVVGVVHHHLTPVIPVEDPGTSDTADRPRLSVMIDAAQFSETLARYRVSQVWHGHGHVPCIRSLAADRRERDAVGGAVDLYPVDIVGLGSSGVSRSRLSDAFPYHSLAVHEVSDTGIENRIFRFSAQSDLKEYRRNTRLWDGETWNAS
jgi:3',5'-cyclic AMP phosphodiesterase CpdA